MTAVEDRARQAGFDLVDDPFVFADAVGGSAPWKPDAISPYFGR